MKARRPWALPLVPLYAAGLAARDGLRWTGLIQAGRLQWPVVSVGSLSAGGAGKTPVAIALAQMLREAGWTVDVLSRGFGRDRKGVAKVVSSAPSAARHFGDEPVLITRRARVPVWVGEDRFLAGAAAEADSETQERCVHLLDDGFQHRQLARSVDVVLVTAADLEDALLPAGNLRERLRALKRADVVVVREEERDRVEARVKQLIRPGMPVWVVRRELGFTQRVSAGQQAVVFCAIARPEDFTAMLSQAGCTVVKAVFFGDHHRYETEDIRRVVQIAHDAQANAVFITEKDEVKLSAAMSERLHAVGPVCVVGLEAKFVDAADVMRDLEARIS